MFDTEKSFWDALAISLYLLGHGPVCVTWHLEIGRRENYILRDFQEDRQQLLSLNQSLNCFELAEWMSLLRHLEEDPAPGQHGSAPRPFEPHLSALLSSTQRRGWTTRKSLILILPSLSVVSVVIPRSGYEFGEKKCRTDSLMSWDLASRDRLGHCYKYRYQQGCALG